MLELEVHFMYLKNRMKPVVEEHYRKNVGLILIKKSEFYLKNIRVPVDYLEKNAVMVQLTFLLTVLYSQRTARGKSGNETLL